MASAIYHLKLDGETALILSDWCDARQFTFQMWAGEGSAIIAHVVVPGSFVDRFGILWAPLVVGFGTVGF